MQQKTVTAPAPAGLGQVLGGLRPAPVMAAAAGLAGLLAALYGPVLKELVSDWWNNPDYSHGLAVPLVSAFVLWRERGRLPRAAFAPSNWGLTVMLGSLGLLMVGRLGAELFTSRISLLGMAAGVVIFLAGWPALRAMSFPLGYLLLAIPIPVLIQNQVVFPLQLLASRMAAASLEVCGVAVLREGNLLYVGRSVIEVAQACSGIRSLMSLIALAVAYGYLAEPRLWARWSLVLLMVPIAVTGNAVRILGTGLLTYLAGQQWAEGALHSFSGLAILASATVLMLVLHWVLSKIPIGRVNAK